MTDLSEFMDEPRKRGGVPCWWRRLDFTDEQREKLEAALTTPEVSSPKISKVLSSWGTPVCSGSVHKHRTGGCACRRSA
jgi:hypothetical protein